MIDQSALEDNNNIEVNYEDIMYNNNINQYQLAKYPFESHSPNLIDQFIILGFQKNYIKKYFPKLIEEKKKQLNNKSHLEIFINKKTEVLNEINFNKEKQTFDHDLLAKIIFPNDLSIIIMKKTQKEDLLPYKVIFSFKSCPGNNILRKYTGLAFVFYLKNDYQDENINVFYPMAYCIISEFPFFTSFSLICEEINKYSFIENNYLVPSEILIYNIVHFTPSPIKKGIKLLFGGKVIKDNNNQINNLYLINPLEKNALDNYNYSGYKEIFFQKISGYPLIDFNLSLLFNLLPPEVIMKTFIYTFLEEEIIFYCQNIETLNMILYIFSILNYPVNDINYYDYIVSVSLNDYLSGYSMFVDKPFSSMIGVNATYNKEIELKKKKKKLYFVLDIENKELNTIYHKNKNSSEEENTIKFYNYLNNILDEKNKKNKNMNFIEKTILNLYIEIIEISKKVISFNHSLYNKKIRFLKNHSNEVLESFQNQNKEIQQIFYSFILNFFDYFYSNCSINESKENIEKNNHLIVNQNKFSVEISENKGNNEFEKLFIHKFNNAMKINSYVINFLLRRDSLILYKIPFIFTEEFIYWLDIFENRKKEINIVKKKSKDNTFYNSKNEKIYFNLIDKLYNNKTKNEFNDLIRNSAPLMKKK